MAGIKKNFSGGGRSAKYIINHAGSTSANGTTETKSYVNYKPNGGYVEGAHCGNCRSFSGRTNLRGQCGFICMGTSILGLCKKYKKTDDATQLKEDEKSLQEFGEKLKEKKAKAAAKAEALKELQRRA
jgi:hypothetical protein